MVSTPIDNKLASITTYMPGDILFYASDNKDPVDIAIAGWTASRLVHTAIAVSAVQKIEAAATGVVKTPIVLANIDSHWLLHVNAAPVNAVNLARALQWLDSQVGQPYGYGDFFNAFLDKFEHGVSLDVGEHFDCSALATEFLIIVGGVKQLTGVNPHEVTPAMLSALLNS